jgi:adhesin transport system membrane fusion protein
MREHCVDLADCRELSLALQARPPRLVHCVLLLLSLLLATALCWAGLTDADLVVRAAGRVRPVTPPQKVVNTARGEVLAGGLGGRVVAVHFRPGDEVRAGDLLVRLDTERLDTESARRKRTIRAGEEELAKLALLMQLTEKQEQAARAKARAELAHAEGEVAQARQRQEAEERQAKAEAGGAADELARTRRLLRSGAASAEAGVKAQAQAEAARARLARAKLPVDDSKVKIAREALVVLERDAAVKREELAARQARMRGEVEAARLELASLELGRKDAELRAPMTGVVTAGEVRVGDVLEPGKPVAEIAEKKGFRFEALVPSEEMAHVRVGMPARVRLDAYDYQRYGTLTGTVCHVAADSTVVEGQRSAFYVVRVELDGEDVGRRELRGKVKLGLAGQVEIVTERQSLLRALLRKVRQTISLG